MNVLNNLWMAISTPNELLINISMAFLAIIFEGPLSLYLILSLFDIKATKKQVFLYIVIFSIISILSKFIIEYPFNVILNYIAGFLMFYFIFKLNIFKTLIASLFPSIVFSLVGVLTTSPYISIFNTNINILFHIKSMNRITPRKHIYIFNLFIFKH